MVSACVGRKFTASVHEVFGGNSGLYSKTFSYYYVIACVNATLARTQVALDDGRLPSGGNVNRNGRSEGSESKLQILSRTHQTAPSVLDLECYFPYSLLKRSLITKLQYSPKGGQNF